MLTLTTILSGIIVVNAQEKDTFRLVPYFNPIIGVNSATFLTWQPLPNLLMDEPYANEEYVWPDATITLTDPDGVEHVIDGPFETTFPPVGDSSIRDVTLIYTPNKRGVWTVTIAWPGDENYEGVTRTDSFLVGPHFEKRQTFAMVSLRPYPAVGLGQEMLVNAWVTPPPQTAREYYENYTFTVRRPNGDVYYEFLVNQTEAPGTTWFPMYFDELGNWTVTMEYPGNWYNQPCEITRTIIVQEEWIEQYQEAPLPSESWTFPLNVYNREWRSIAGPWYQQNYNASGLGWNPYTEAPKSAHVLWKLPPISGLGGFVGLEESSMGITTQNIYTSSSANIRTVMAGRAYYSSGGRIYCVDMKTGETLWDVSGSFNVGALRSRNPVLYSIGTRFIEYNGLTGAVSRNLTGIPNIPPNPAPDVPLSTAYTGAYFFDDPYFYRTFSGWYNNSKGDWDDGFVIKYNTANGRIEWNATFAAGPLTSAYATIHNNLLISRCFTVGTIIVQQLKALNLTTGELEYATPIMDKSDPDSWVYRQGPALGSAYDLVYFAGTSYEGEYSAYFAFNASTGEQEWVARFPTDRYPWNNFFAYMPQTAGYDQMFVLSYAGVYALNRTNGEIEWYYYPGNSQDETPYNTWPFGSTGAVVGGGVVFAPSTEHSPTLYYRGTKLHAIDAFTGDGLWTILGYYTPTAVAYGTLIANDVPNGGTYAFCKGETLTSVAVQNPVSAMGSAVLITGSVLDQSPAQPDTPAIADESMTAWMEYLHLQQPYPMDAMGVEVTLGAVAPDGEYVMIGSTTSNTDGNFGISWIPDMEGTYQIIATFEGSESYFASHASTFMAVGPAAPQASPSVPPTTAPPTSPTVPPTTAPPTSPSVPPTTPPPTSPTVAPPETPGPGMDIYIVAAAVAIIAAVAAAAVILRRRQK